MERLDRERHADAPGVLERRGDAVADVAPRREQVLRLRRAGERAGQAADDEHQARRLELLGLVDGAPVVVERGTAAGGVHRREHAAAAVAGELEHVPAHQLGGALEADRMHLVAPGRDRADAVARAGVDDAIERPAPRSVAVLIDSQRWSAEKSRTVIASQSSMPCSASR